MTRSNVAVVILMSTSTGSPTTGGLRITTTLDLKLQRMAEEHYITQAQADGAKLPEIPRGLVLLPKSVVKERMEAEAKARREAAEPTETEDSEGATE